MAKQEEKKLPEGLADAPDTAAAAPSDEGAEAAPAGKGKRKLILIGVAALVALGGGGGAFFWLTGGGESAETAGHGGGHGGGHGEEGAAKSFVDVPPMTVNLRSPDGAARFLKVHLMLVPGTAGEEAIGKQLPLVIDSYQPFLRELRPEDLAGSAATFRLKEEMLVRANAVLGQGAVRDVLIQDLVQQ